MYKCILWSGANLPLPKMEDDVPDPDRCCNWRPLFASKEQIPLFWWILLGRFNCFWLDNGTPTFVVDRVSALARAGRRMGRLGDVMSSHQRSTWQTFYECLDSCEDDMLYIQLHELWRTTWDSNAEQFNAYIKSFLFPLEGGDSASLSQRKQRYLLLTELFASSGPTATELYGERLHQQVSVTGRTL